MSQTLVWTTSKGNTVRHNRDTGNNQGSGNNVRLYVGRHGNYDYDSYILLDDVWTDVGKIVRAVLTVTTDDHTGTFEPANQAHVVVRRLTDAFGEGSSPSSAFNDDDYTSASGTTSDQRSVDVSHTAGGVNNIDVTAIVEDWAPKRVKRRNGDPGGGKTNYGLGLFGTSDTDEEAVFWSEDHSPSGERPYLTLTFEYGHTTPTTPGTLSPSGAVASLSSFQGTFADAKTTDKLAYSEVAVYASDGTTLLYHKKLPSSATEIENAIFDHVPTDVSWLVAGTTYKWKARVWDQAGDESAYTSLTSFHTTNTAPNAPTLDPAALTGASSDGIFFKGDFTDADGDTFLAYQVQMSAYAQGDAHWDDAAFILWDTGKVYMPVGSTTWSTPYGGAELTTAGTYYWRARVWDGRQAVGAFSYGTLVTSGAFEPDPDADQTTIQLRPRAPWRIVIKDMGALRGPGNIVGVIEDAKNVGASLLFNSPGELHFTLPKDHPQISVIEAKLTHYSVQFRDGDGWREKFAGLMWDWDASDTDVIFYGIDYLALLDYVLDERYDANKPDKASENGGSKYVTSGKNSIHYIVDDQLDRAKAKPNSPVGFITVGAIATMNETLTVFSTYSPTLTFITGLLDSHRAGTGKKTRLYCRQKTGGGYEWTVVDDPGQLRSGLTMRYGELVQGYRVIPFGTDWASRISAIGRAKDGIAVLYKTYTAPGIDESVWGRFTQTRLMDGVSDENDLARRTKQAAVHAGKLGKSIALGLRSGVLQPRDGYDLCDMFPVEIIDGSVDTTAFGSGNWTAVGITWECDAQYGKQTTTLTLTPVDDSVAPDTDLLTLNEVSPQAEWQIGWTSPNPLTVTSKYWLDQSTGIVYVRVDGVLVATGITGTP